MTTAVKLQRAGLDLPPELIRQCDAALAYSETFRSFVRTASVGHLATKTRSDTEPWSHRPPRRESEPSLSDIIAFTLVCSIIRGL